MKFYCHVTVSNKNVNCGDTNAKVYDVVGRVFNTLSVQWKELNLQKFCIKFLCFSIFPYKKTKIYAK